MNRNQVSSEIGIILLLTGKVSGAKGLADGRLQTKQQLLRYSHREEMHHS
jgi:hypothetical protein